MKTLVRFFIFAVALMGFVFTTCKIDSDEPDAAITYTVAADGNATAASTAITFTFGDPVAGLTRGDIILSGGAITPGTLVSGEDGTVQNYLLVPAIGGEQWFDGGTNGTNSKPTVPTASMRK